MKGKPNVLAGKIIGWMIILFVTALIGMLAVKGLITIYHWTF